LPTVTKTVAPYGSWRSPISADALVADRVRLSSVAVDGDDVYWVEGRPSEGGRQVLVRRRDGVVEDMSAPGDNVRTLVHEYGGRSYAVRDGVVVWSSFADQRLRVIGHEEPITPEPPLPRSVRYADHELSPDGRWVLCVRERHEVAGASEAVNDLVAVAVDGSGSVNLLADGHDFFSSPRLSPDGRRLAWLSWDHPNMPWDGTELWVADVVLDADVVDVGRPRRLAGGPDESVSEPRWSPSGVLHWASDASGWWNLYAEDAGHLVEMDADFASPEWVFGNRSYAFLADGTLFASWWSEGMKRFGVVRRDGGDGDDRGVGKLEELDLPFTVGGSLVGLGDGAVVGVFASPRQAMSVVRVDVAGGSFEVLRSSGSLDVDDASISVPKSIEFPTEGDRRAFALFYPPANAEFDGPAGERPPLIVLSHGGPTSQATADLDAEVQFWTTRGVAVVDVNYGGSTGYGRAYRDRLKGTWGVTDVDDCVHAAQWLAAQGLVDERRLVIKGGSAGGYTTLAALTFRPGVFALGSSHYGVADAEALARDTHKFESRYLDGLIGPYPAAADVYRERSPIRHTDRLSCPLILFQGLEDMVVPPDQAEMMVAALDAKGIPHAYLAFDGEQHGFRQASTIVRVAESELYFLGRVLGFSPADELAPVRIAHEDALRPPA
jgi:dipeptidyl aminopeptidase/acylaminoacyl peptidase